MKLIHLIHDVFLEPSHQILEICRGVEVFLFKSLLLVYLTRHVWIVDTCQILSILDFVDFLNELNIHIVIFFV
jgi:hypothetical protein